MSLENTQQETKKQQMNLAQCLSASYKPDKQDIVFMSLSLDFDNRAIHRPQ